MVYNYKEIISNYRAIVDELNMYKMEEYLALLKNDMSLSNILQMKLCQSLIKMFLNG